MAVNPCWDKFKKEHPDLHNYLKRKTGSDFDGSDQSRSLFSNAAKHLQNESLSTLNDVYTGIGVKGFEKKGVAPEAQDAITVSEMVDKVGSYKGQRGRFYQDGQAVIFKVEGQPKEYELGNIDEVGNSPISSFDIANEESVVTTNEGGELTVRGENYKNNFSDPFAAINYGKDGNIVSVNLENAEGKKRTFRGNIAEDLAYQIHLQQISNSDATRQSFEDYINQDPESQEEMESETLSETAEDKTTSDNEVVSREKIEAKVVEPKVAKKKTTTDKYPTKKEFENAEQVNSEDDATSRLSNGERIFAVPEMDEQPIELTSVEEIPKYAPDQLIAIPRDYDPFVKPSSTKNHSQNIKDKFRKQFKAKGISDEQIDGAVALMDARAKSWASEEKGRTPEQWFDKIADVKSGEFESADVQYQGGKLKAAIVGAAMLQGGELNQTGPGTLQEGERAPKEFAAKQGTFIDIKDNRTVDAVTGKKLEPTRRLAHKANLEVVRDIVRSANKQEVDPFTALAMAYQETGLSGYGDNEENTFHVLNNDKNFYGENAAQTTDNGVFLIKQYFDHAKKLGKKGEAEVIQAWNGYGKVGKNTEGSQRALYGIDVSKQPIDMSKNPVYGKRIIDIRDNILKKNPELAKIVEQEKNNVAFQQEGGIKHGALETLRDGRVVIHALEAPDFSTMVHEIFHVFEKDLTAAEKKQVDEFGGSEAFARAGEKYLRTGVAPNTELEPLFKKFKEWLKNIYKSLSGSPIEKRISPDIKKIFDRLLSEKTAEVKPTEAKPAETKAAAEPSTSKKIKVFDVSIGEVNTEKDVFQNRETEFSQESVDKIKKAANEGTFNWEEFDPVLLWKNPKDSKLYVLSGHSRLEAFKQLSSEGNKDFDKIPSKIIEGNLDEARQVAMRSNTLGTKESPIERASYYRKQREAGKSKSELADEAKDNEGRNANTIVALSYLNPKGKAVDSLRALGQEADTKSKANSIQIARWIGETRRMFPQVSNEHENEIFDWLAGGAYDKIKNIGDITSRLNTIISRIDFDATQPLNLENKATKTYVDEQYEAQLKEKEDAIKEQQKLIDVKTKRYHENELSASAIAEKNKEDNAILHRLQKDLIDLKNKKSQIAQANKSILGLFDNIQNEIKDGNIKPEQVERIAGLTDAEATEFESSVEALESKAEIENEQVRKETAQQADELILKYGTPKVIKVGGVNSVVDKSETIGDVKYELFKGETPSEKRAAFKITDVESGNVVTLKKYPTYEQALKEYNKTIDAAKKSEVTKPISINGNEEESSESGGEGREEGGQESRTEEENVKTSEQGGESASGVTPPFTSKKAGDAVRKFADKLRTGKINKLGGFKSTTGFDAVWDASLEVVAKALEGGALIADAIQSGLDYIKGTDWYNNLTDKEGFDEKYSEHMESESQSDESWLQRRFTKQMLRSDELSDAEKGEVSKTLNYARRRNAITIQEANNVIDTVGLSEAQNLVMTDGELNPAVRVTVSQILIKKYSDLASKAHDEAIKNYYLDKAIQTASFVTEKLGTEAGQSIQAFSLWSRLSPEGQLRAANQDKAAQGKEKLRKRKKDIKVISDKFTTANEEAADELTKSTEVKKSVEKAVSNAAEKAKEKIQRAKDKRKKLFDKYKGKKGGGLTLSSGGLTKEGIEYVGELVKTYIDEGIANIQLVGTEIIEHLKSIGANVSDEVSKSVNDIIREQFDVSTNKKTAKALGQLEKDIQKIVKDHYTIPEEAKTTLINKFIETAGLEKEEAEQLSKEIQSEFDRIASRKKRNILYNEKARFDKINTTLAGDKKPEPKTVQSDIIKYSNLGAFDEEEFAEMVASKFGIGEISKEQAAKLIELANRIQKSPEGSPKNNATEDLLNYRAKLRGNDLGETAQAVWYSNVLSGYKTHEKNLVSTFFNSMAELGAEMLKDPKAIPYILAGYGKGVLTRGRVEAAHTIKTGRSPIHIKKIETPNVLERKAFLGGGFNPANWFKYVMRLMVAEDVLSFQGLKEARAYQLARREAQNQGYNTWSKKGWDRVNEILLHTKERWAEADVQATEEGMKGLEKKRRIYELMENSRPTKMTQDAYGFAAHGTFNHESEGSLGAITNVVAGALDAVSVGGVKPLRFLVPFTRIITNVVNNSLDFTPVGFVRGARGVRGFRSFGGSSLTKSAFKELDKGERQRLIAKAAIGVSLTAILQGLHEAGIIAISGAGPDDDKKKQQLMQEGWQPYSIKIGNKWYSYQYTPMVFMTGFLGNMNDAKKYGGADSQSILKQTQIAASRIGGQIVDMTWINSASTFLGALAERNPNSQSKQLSGLLGNTVKGFVPFSGAITQSSQFIQNAFQIPQKQVNNAWQALIQDIPIARNSLDDKINALGDPVVRDNDVVVSTETKDPVWKYLLEKNGWVAPVNKNTIIVYDPELRMDRPVSNNEYYEFSKSRGQKIKQQIQNIIDDGATVVTRGGAVKKTADELTENELNVLLTNIEGAATKQTKKELFEPRERNRMKIFINRKR